MRTRRGSSLIQDLALIAILVGAAYLFFPSWFSWLPVGQNTFQGELTVNYVDGTSHTYTGSMIPQAVAQSPYTTAISSIVYTVKATPTWMGTTPTSVGSVSWTVVGSITVDGVNKQPIALNTGLPSSVTNGQTVTVSTTTISGATLNGWIPFDYATHAMVCTASASMTFTAPGENPKTIDGLSSASTTLKNIGFPALLTVQVSSTVS